MQFINYTRLTKRGTDAQDKGRRHGVPAPHSRKVGGGRGGGPLLTQNYQAFIAIHRQKMAMGPWAGPT